MTTKNIAKAVVINTHGQVLLIRRSRTDTRRPGEWDFPGGGVDEGEDFTQAVIREIEEEVGFVIQKDAVQLLYVATKIETHNQITESINRMLFVCRVNEQQATQIRLSFEHDESQWMSPLDALDNFPHPFYGVGLKYALDNGLFTP